MKLKELMLAKDFTGKYYIAADESRFKHLVAFAIKHDLNWPKIIGEPNPNMDEREKSRWKQILNSLSSQARSNDDLKVIDSLKTYLKSSGLQEYVNLFSDAGPYKLKESFSDYLGKLV